MNNIERKCTKNCFNKDSKSHQSYNVFTAFTIMLITIKVKEKSE